MSKTTSHDGPKTRAFRISELSQNAPTNFEITPNPEECSVIAAELGILGARKIRFVGAITAFGKNDWQLKGHLGATVIQACAVTLAPVTTRVETDVERQFIKEFDEYDDEEEVEMPEDDRAEPLGATIDPNQVLIEALSLAMPDYPRAPDASFEAAQFSAQGIKAMTDDDARPFAGLASLKDQLDPKG